MRKPAINVVVVRRGNQYEAANGKIERIGDEKGKWVRWNITNDAPAPIHVKIHNFSPGPCPVQQGHFSNCEYDTQAPGQSAFEVGEERTIRAKLTNRSGLYTYEFYVSDPQTGVGNPVDPELQIDDPRPVHPLKWILATVGLLGALALAYRWLTRER